MSDILYIVMPAYNEEANILSVLEGWYPVVEKIAVSSNSKSRLVIMDDGSADNTFEIMQQFASTHPLFIPLQHRNAGHGATLLELYHFAIDSGADYVFQTDSDGQTNPAEFPGFWADRKEFDMIIGWRRDRGDGASRVMVTKVLRKTIKMTFKVDIIDANTPFRLMSAETLEENLSLVPDEFNLSNVVLSVAYTKKHQRVDYRECTFLPRQGGVNSINLPRIFKIGKEAIGDFRRINQHMEEQLNAGQ